MHLKPIALAALLAPLLASAQTAQDRFWQTLQAHCGRAYGGTLVNPQPQDERLKDQPLVMHVRDCGDREMRIPFHVGADRSRTWVLTRTADGLRLKHDHRHADGLEDRLSQYGGDSADAGSAETQRFAADAFTAELVPGAKTNVWTMSLDAQRFSYRLERRGTERRFEAVFDLSRPVPLPPPAWGQPGSAAASSPGSP